MKRFFSFVLVIAMLAGVLPVASAVSDKGTMTISKDFKVFVNFEHATGVGFKMSDLGIKGGQQWEEYTPIKVGDVNNGVFSADLIVEKQRVRVGTMTAKFTVGGDLEIIYECLSGYHLQQGARLDIVDDPSKFKSDARGDLPFRSANDNYAGATIGSITVGGAKLTELGIDRHNDGQTFYVFLRLDKVAGGIYSNINRSWIDSDYEYEFMIFSLTDFNGKGYKDQKVIEKAVKTDVNGVLANGISPVSTVFCKPRDSVAYDLPVGKYLVAEIFRDRDGSIIDAPDFVNVSGADGVFTINMNKNTKVDVKNDFSRSIQDIIGVEDTLVMGRVTIEKTGELLTGADVMEELGNIRYVPQYENRLLPDAVFDIIARENIITPDGTVRAAAGDVVGTVTTDADGKAESELLYLGDYYVVEREAPFGMVLDAAEYDFSLAYQGQAVPIVFSQVSVYDERQKAEVSLIKWCEIPNNPPQGYNPYASVVFGLFAREDILSVDGGIVIPKGGLLECVTPDSDGNAAFQADLPFGSYYVVELKTGEKYYLDDNEYDFVFGYAGQDIGKVDISVNDGNAIENFLKGSMTISKDFKVFLNFEHATGAGVKMSDLGITGGQQWEEYTPIKVGDVNNGTFSADIIVEKQRVKVGITTAQFTDGGDLEIIYECLSGYHLQQGARLEIVDDPSKFTSDARGDLPFRSVNDNYAGATKGSIIVPAADLITRGIDRFNNDQEFYVFLRLDRVAGGIYSNENRSWIDSGYTYEFMVFDLYDFNGKGYSNQKAIEQAVKTAVNGVLAKGIEPIATVFCQAGDSVTFDLPAGKHQPAGKYLVAEIFRDADGNIIDNPDFVNVSGADGAFTINPDKNTNVEVKNDFSIFIPWESIPDGLSQSND